MNTRKDLIILTAVCSIVVIAGGSLSAFAAYSQALATALGESDVDIVGSFGDFGVYSGFIMGMLNDKYGARKTLVIATTCLVLGYAGAWAMTGGTLGSSVELLCIFYFMIGQGSFGFFITCLSVNNGNFAKKDRTKVMGYFLCLYGAAGIAFTLIYDLGCNSDIISFYGTLTVLSLIAGLLGIVFVRKLIFPDTNVIIPTNAGYDSFDSSTRSSSSHIAMMSSHQRELYDPDDSFNKESSLLQATHDDIDDDDAGITGVKLLTNKSFWKIFSVFFLFTGPCLMWKNILGTFGAAFEMNGSDINALVYGWSGFNSSLRIVVGALADTYYAKSPIVFPRFLWILIFALFGLMSHLLYLMAADSVVWIITACTAGVYAANFAIVATQTSLYFGTKYYGFNMGIMSLAPAISGLSFTAISAEFTAAAANENGLCLGATCFTATFIMSSFAFAAGILLVIHVMKKDIERHKNRNQFM